MLAQFKIPLLPPSINQMYKVNYRTRQVYLDKSVREFKTKAMRHIPDLIIHPDTELEVKILYFGKFYTKAGKIRIKDGQNLDKCLYDIMFKKWMIDDSRVFRGIWEKVESKDEYTLVVVNKKEPK